MREELQAKLRKGTAVLCEQLDPDNELRRQLVNILTPDQLETVYNQYNHSTKADRVHKIIDFLKLRPDEAYFSFRLAVIKAEREDLVNDYLPNLQQYNPELTSASARAPGASFTPGASRVDTAGELGPPPQSAGTLPVTVGSKPITASQKVPSDMAGTVSSNAAANCMTKEHKERITKSLAKLADEMNVEEILPELVTEEVLNRHERDEILSKPTQKKKTQYFLMDILPTKADWTFDALVSILTAKKMEHHAKVLQGTA